MPDLSEIIGSNMDIDQWQVLKEKVTSKFPAEEEGVEDLIMDTKDGEVKQGTAEFVVITTPLGRVKLSFQKRPLVLDKKFIVSHRAGQDARTEYTFSDTEFTYKLRAYKWNEVDEDWDEIDAEHFSR